MPKCTGWLSLLGFFGLVSAAGAQAPSSPTASTQFDGTYTFVSSTAGSRSGNQLDRPKADFRDDRSGGRCPEEFRPGPLTVAQGRVQWITPGTGREWGGTVGSHGELAVRLIAQPRVGFEAMGSGIIDHDGTVRLHMASAYCSYGLLWQKEHK
jgi:hypothetical protein